MLFGGARGPGGGGGGGDGHRCCVLVPDSTIDAISILYGLREASPLLADFYLSITFRRGRMRALHPLMYCGNGMISHICVRMFVLLPCKRQRDMYVCTYVYLFGCRSTRWTNIKHHHMITSSMHAPLYLRFWATSTTDPSREWGEGVFFSQSRTSPHPLTHVTRPHDRCPSRLMTHTVGQSQCDIQ